MYLSRLILNPRSRSVQYDLGNYYQLHRTLMKAFPTPLPDGERILFRVEQTRRSIYILVQSHTPPDWAFLEQKKNYLLPPLDCPPQILDNPSIKTFSLNLLPQQRFTFRLRANPTVKHRRGDPDETTGRNKGKRDPLYHEEAQLQWLQAKGDQHGFRLLKTAIFDEGNFYIWRTASEGRRTKMTFHAVRFEGVLEVTDPQALAQAISRGIGPAKSFGFGLLSLARY